MLKLVTVSVSILVGLFFVFQKPQDVVKFEFILGYDSFKIDHTAWDKLLKKYVDADGNVDYKTFKTNSAPLTDYLGYLAQNGPTESWSRNEALAYYINMYNAATVLLILENYPTESIKDIHKPWDTERVTIGSKTYSLGDIEHKILRKMNEPRIHFAINCASYSCPKLLNEAFTAAQLESQLARVTTDFLTDIKRNRIKEDDVQLSNIFKWFKKDFTENGSLLDYINVHTKINISADAKITYLNYDWSLNENK